VCARALCACELNCANLNHSRERDGLEFDRDDRGEVAGGRDHRHRYAERDPEHPAAVGRRGAPVDKNRCAGRGGAGQRVPVQPWRGRAASAQTVEKTEFRGHARYAGPKAGHGRGQFCEERGAERHTRSDRISEEEQRGLHRTQAKRHDRQELEEQKDQHCQLVPRLRAQLVRQPLVQRDTAVRRQIQHHQFRIECAPGPDRIDVRATAV